MMKSNGKVTQTMIIAAMGIGLVAAMTEANAKPACKVEKCYGIVKKAKNDCGTSKHACAAQAKTSGDPSEWMFVMKGNCERIVGGSLKPSNK